MQSTAPTARMISIPSGAPGVRATLKQMVKMVQLYSVSPTVRDTAARLVADLPPHDTEAEISALQRFVRDAVRYTGDVLNFETLQSPVVTLGYRELEPPHLRLDGTISPGRVEPGGVAVGDCDDKSTLLASLMASIGIPGAFCAVKVGGELDFSHVLVEAKVRGRGKVEYIPCETILPGVEAGWFPPDASCFMLAHW